MTNDLIICISDIGNLDRSRCNQKGIKETCCQLNHHKAKSWTWRMEHSRVLYLRLHFRKHHFRLVNLYFTRRLFRFSSFRLQHLTRSLTYLLCLLVPCSRRAAWLPRTCSFVWAVLLWDITEDVSSLKGIRKRFSQNFFNTGAVKFCLSKFSK